MLSPSAIYNITSFECSVKAICNKIFQAARLKEKKSVLFTGEWDYAGKFVVKLGAETIKYWLLVLYTFKIGHVAIQRTIFNTFSKKITPICRSF